MKSLLETKKEDDFYFQGAFWIKGESVKEIKEGTFELLIGSKLLTDFYGDYVRKDVPKKSALTHKNLWSNVSDEHTWEYYPRGRVAIDQGAAYIHLNSQCTSDKIVEAIIKEYGIEKLRIVLDYNNEYQGSHYNFELK